MLLFALLTPAFADEPTPAPMTCTGDITIPAGVVVQPLPEPALLVVNGREFFAQRLPGHRVEDTFMMVPGFLPARGSFQPASFGDASYTVVWR